MGRGRSSMVAVEEVVGADPHAILALVRDAPAGNRADPDIHTVRPVAAIAVAAAPATPAGPMASRGGLTPLRGRIHRVLPAPAVFDVYASVRSMTG
ncbi:hypothetical protein ABZ690_27765 [Streptomyces sp. NPDC006967]|uniref:hypothetical protein n=1 Tax=unclassified Streptomyces TaxID=2593676 RepID=UPI0011B0C6BD|nr:hypothetical protein [Streptomyces sp. SM1]